MAYRLIQAAIFILLVPTGGYAQGDGQERAAILGVDGGRYVFGQVSNFRRDQYMLDTTTGRIWQIVEDSDKRLKLQPVPYKQLTGLEAYIPDPETDAEQEQAATRKAIWGDRDPFGFEEP